MRLRPILTNLGISIGSLILFFGILDGTARLVWTSERIGSCVEAEDILLFKIKPSCEFRQKKTEGDTVLYQIIELLKDFRNILSDAHAPEKYSCPW